MEQTYLLQKHILDDLNIPLQKNSYILDFGCGRGEMLKAYIQNDFKNVYGYDIVNYFTSDPERFINPGNLNLHHNKFDLIFSQQVLEHVINIEETLSEIYNLLKPGDISIHYFPAKFSLIEPHLKVPFASFIQYPAYLKFWAYLGIKNEFQKNKSAKEAYLANIEYCNKHLNYQSTKNIKRVFSEKFQVQFIEHIYLKHTIGRLRHLPLWLRKTSLLSILLRTFSSHVILAKKP